MEIDLVFKIAAIGIIVAVLNQLLIRSVLVKQISTLFVTIKALFSL